MNKKFPKEELQSCAYEDSVKLENIESELIDTTRWSTHHTLVFKDVETGKYYKTSYSQGATECQDESPFEHESDMVDCYEVEQKEVTTIKWIAVKD